MKNLSKYLEVKEEMKTGDMLLWKSHSLLGWLIRKKIHSNYTHTALVIRLSEYEGLERRRWVTEALEHGTVLNLLSRRLLSYSGECWWVPLREDCANMRQGIGEKALGLIGIPYDYSSIIKQLIAKVSADVRSLFCFELSFLSYGGEGKVPTPDEMMETMEIFKEPVKILE